MKYVNRLDGERCRHGFIGDCPMRDECNVTDEEKETTMTTDQLLQMAHRKRARCRSDIKKLLRELEDHNGFIGYLIHKRKQEQAAREKAS